MAYDVVRDLPEKLRATAALLGCANQKDLCAAFRHVNPNSDFDLERSYKWMQGRALPRSARVYEDWAALVGAEGRSPSWLAACALEEFVDVLCARHGLERGALLRRAGLGAASAGADESATAAFGPDGYLCGAYACYSHAQSPYYRGRIIRGALVVEPASRRAEGLVATYSQALPSGRAQASGPIGFYGLALCLELRVPSPGMAPLFCSLFRPSPPTSVLAGVMCGTAAVHPGGQPPYATRIAMVRVLAAAGADLQASNRYLGPAEWPPSRDLAALGLPMPDPAALDAEINRFLRPGGGTAGCDQAPLADYAALAMACDRMWLEHADRAGVRVPLSPSRPAPPVVGPRVPD
ncbi:MAG: hypothetical protein ICV73_05690 [Acetobacteraceae bacterium]|nr:hypothetical protein [Acetobacteraceae bacterium]